jgi:hypothetical protein
MILIAYFIFLLFINKFIKIFILRKLINFFFFINNFFFFYKNKKREFYIVKKDETGY